MIDLTNLVPEASTYLMVSGGVLLNLFTVLTVKDEIVSYINRRKWAAENAKWEAEFAAETAATPSTDESVGPSPNVATTPEVTATVSTKTNG